MRCQCGLLDDAVDPAYAQNRRAWLTFTESGPGATARHSRAPGWVTTG
jgi:hypothetical protein